MKKLIVTYMEKNKLLLNHKINIKDLKALSLGSFLLEENVMLKITGTKHGNEEWKKKEVGTIKSKKIYLLENKEKIYNVAIDEDYNILIHESEEFNGNVLEAKKHIESREEMEKEVHIFSMQLMIKEYGFISMLNQLSFGNLAFLHEVLELEGNEEYKKNREEALAVEVMKIIQNELENRKKE